MNGKEEGKPEYYFVLHPKNTKYSGKYCIEIIFVGAESLLLSLTITSQQ
jgi:hypothetical protein